MAWALREQKLAKQRQGEAEAARGREREQRELAEKRQKETQQVADFQVAMLNGIDVEAMGRGIKQLFRDQVGATLERQWVGEFPERRPRTPEEVEAKLLEFDEHADAAHAVDVARGVMDEFVLARAAKALEERFADQPLVKADLHSAIGATYQALGLYSPAETHHRIAMEIYRQERGDAHPYTLICIENMGGVLHLLGRDTEAEPYYREVLDARQRALGDDAPDTLAAIHGMGYLFHSQGRHTDAEEYYRKAVEGRLRVLGAEDRDTLISIDNLGVLLSDMGKLDEAERFSRQAMDGFRLLLGDADLDTLTAINNMGGLLKAMRRYAEAEPYILLALEGRRSALGNEATATLMSINNLGDLLHYQDRPRRGGALLHRVVESVPAHSGRPAPGHARLDQQPGLPPHGPRAAGRGPVSLRRGHSDGASRTR